MADCDGVSQTSPKRPPLAVALASGAVILGDGAMGTLLHARGLRSEAIPEVANLEIPAAVRQAHSDYVAAGAQFVVTNTIGGTAPRLQAAGLEHRVKEVNRAAALLAREAVREAIWVLGSMGPTGQLIEPWGPMSASQAEAAYAEQARGLVEGGVDGLLIETQHTLEEVLCAMRAARRVTEVPILCSFAFDGRARTLMGLRAEVAGRGVESAGAAAVGANCGSGPEAVRAAVSALAQVTRLPLLARANAGLPQLLEGRTVWGLGPAEMAEHNLAFVAAGARVLGGCCGTTPAHIAATVSALRSSLNGKQSQPGGR